jgi:hypothetical protein
MNDPYGQSSWSQPTTTTVAQPEPAPSTAMATWALVLGAIPLPVGWLVSIGLGIAVLVRSKDGRNHGKTLVIIGFSLIAIWIVLTAAVIGVAIAYESQAFPDRPEDGTGEVLIEDVRVGDCLARDLTDEVTYVELTSCNASHRLEAYAVFDLPDGPFPGQGDVDRWSDTGCTERFENFIGLPYDESEIGLQYVTPVKDIWDYDRSVVCFADTDGMTTGTLKAARR